MVDEPDEESPPLLPLLPGTWGALSLPFPLLITGECFGMQFPATIGGIALTLHVPSVRRSPEGGRAIVGWDLPTAREFLSVDTQHVDDARSWGEMRHDLPPDQILGNVTRLLVQPVDDELSAESGRAVFGALDDWLDRFGQWVGTMSNQYTGDQSRRRDQANVPGDRLRLWHVSDDAVGVFIHSPILFVFLDAVVESLEPHELAACVANASAGTDAPVERVLLSQARNALAAHQFRSAVLDAGAACELVLYRHVERLLGSVDRSLSKKLIERATLGRLVDLAGLKVDQLDVKDALVRVRNEVAHKGIVPTEVEARKVVNVTAALIKLLG